MGAFENTEGTVLIDVGGDDVGATALGRFRHQIQARDYEMLYVVNANRNLTPTSQDALEILHEIEAVSGLRVTGIINNTHLQYETTCETVKAGEEFGLTCAQEAELPLVCVSVPESLECEGLRTPPEQQYRSRIYVRPPW
jgi:hypothetical protein